MKRGRGALTGVALVVGLGLPLGVVLAGGPELHKAPALKIRTDEASGVDTTTTAPAPVDSTPPTAPARAPGDVKVRVHNGSTKPGGAVRVGDRLKQLGYNVTAPGANPKKPAAATRILFRSGFDAEALALAASLGLPATSVEALGNDPLLSAGDAAIVVVAGDDIA